MALSTLSSGAAYEDYKQPGDLFRLMGKEAQTRLIDNIVSSLSKVPRRIQELQAGYFYKADPNYGEGLACRGGEGVAMGLGLSVGELAAQ